ncbi:MAG: hypothetical protein IKF96_05445 [Eggerthellaceae bacterium]|nr:hypothetical protein [Eggerthellaceae bacterium]
MSIRLGMFSRWVEGIPKPNLFTPSQEAFFEGMSFCKPVVWVDYAESRGFLGRWKTDEAKEDVEAVGKLPEMERSARERLDYLRHIGINAEMERRDSYSNIHGYSEKDFRKHRVEYVIRYQLSASEVREAVRLLLVAQIQSLRDNAGQWTDRIVQSGVVDIAFKEFCSLLDTLRERSNVRSRCTVIRYNQSSDNVVFGGMYGLTRTITFKDLGFNSFDTLAQQDAFRAALLDRVRMAFDEPGASVVNVRLRADVSAADIIELISVLPLPDPQAGLKSW